MKHQNAFTTPDPLKQKVMVIVCSYTVEFIHFSFSKFGKTVTAEIYFHDIAQMIGQQTSANHSS